MIYRRSFEIAPRLSSCFLPRPCFGKNKCICALSIGLSRVRGVVFLTRTFAFPRLGIGAEARKRAGGMYVRIFSRLESFRVPYSAHFSLRYTGFSCPRKYRNCCFSWYLGKTAPTVFLLKDRSLKDWYNFCELLRTVSRILSWNVKKSLSYLLVSIPFALKLGHLK